MARGYREPGEKPRRFYTSVETAPVDGGFAVTLDGRPLRGPKGAHLVLPTEALADMVAGEWRGQGEHLDIAGMHATRLANTAIEAVAAAHESTARSIADYAASDLTCYFAEEPDALVSRQTQGWGPVLDRAERELSLRFVRASGIVHQTQPAETLAAVKGLALELDNFRLTGLAFGASLFGSAVLAIALMRGWLTGEDAFALSRIDEAWQEERWGVDAEAAERTERLRGEAGMLEAWFRALDD